MRTIARSIIPGRIRLLWMCIFAFLPPLAGCASNVKFRPVSDTPVRIGKPYQVRGISYTPADEPLYDRVGYASWYGNESGRQTANGEKFRHGSIAAAHTTLPLPSYVEVTALDTGRTILVRINDRGPFIAGRIIDLSPAAADQLGIRRQGIAAVRVRRVSPSEHERARLRDGKPTTPRISPPEEVLTELRARLTNGG